MDTFTRRYVMLLGVLVAIGAVWWVSQLDFTAGSLNRVLEADGRLAAYPYRFRVTAVENGTAVMLTPRSPQLPATKFLPLLQPELAGLASDDPALVAAQQELAALQAHARALVLAQPDVERVRWELDRRWFEERGVPVD